MCDFILRSPRSLGFYFAQMLNVLGARQQREDEPDDKYLERISGRVRS
jgi:hypothetical protein